MMPVFSSLRWRLTFSYAAIALIAIASLGAILLLALRGYYIRQERLYLVQNAEAIAHSIQVLNADDFDQDILDSQVVILGFLTQTRVEILDAHGRLMADSGSPNSGSPNSGAPNSGPGLTSLSIRVQAGDVLQEFVRPLGASQEDSQYQSLVIVDDETGRYQSSTTVNQFSDGIDLSSPLFVFESPTSFGLGTVDAQSRSSQVVVRELFDFAAGEQGEIRLSEGPAFGQAILMTVAWATVVAGGFAALLSMGFGLQMSRRISQPIVHLATVADRMTAGDVDARAEIQADDEIGRLATSFNQMADRLTQTIFALRQFVADAAHELNTPLTALRTNLDLVARRPDDERYQQAALSQVDRMQMLTSNLLDLAQIEAGVASPADKVGPVDLVALVGRLSENFASRAEQADLTFDTALPENGSVIVTATEMALTQVLENLIDNALKFTLAPGSIVLALNVDDARACILLTDTGIGVNGDAHRIFDRFYRAQNTANFPGSGLGLAIVKTLVEQMNGEIVYRPLATGSQFELYLPLAAS